MSRRVTCLCACFVWNTIVNNIFSLSRALSLSLSLSLARSLETNACQKQCRVLLTQLKLSVFEFWISVGLFAENRSARFWFISGGNLLETDFQTPDWNIRPFPIYQNNATVHFVTFKNVHDWRCLIIATGIKLLFSYRLFGPTLLEGARSHANIFLNISCFSI